MIIGLHLNGYYDWEPVPEDVDVTEADIEARRVKPAQNGGFLMRVDKKGDAHTTITVPEEEIISMIVQEMTRGDKIPLSRLQAAHRFITRYHLNHNTHKKWIQEVEVHDDGPQENLLRAILDTHVKAGNISEHDVEELVATYMLPSSADDHVDHLHKSYSVKPERVAASRERRIMAGVARVAAHAAHIESVDVAASKVPVKKASSEKGVTQ